MTARETIEDDYFGHRVADPYRWLEDDLSDQTADWVNRQNDLTQSFLSEIPFKESIKARMTEKLSAPSLSGYQLASEYLYFQKHDAKKNQPVIYREPVSGGEPELFLDVNTLSEDGKTSVRILSFSQSHAYAAIVLSDGGSDWGRVIVIDSDTKALVDDAVSRVKFTGISWQGDEGFYYSTYPSGEGSLLSARTDDHKAYFHKLNQPSSADTLVFGTDMQERYRYVGAEVSHDQQWLIAYGANVTATNTLWVRPLGETNLSWSAISKDSAARLSYVGSDEDALLIFTDYKAPNGRLVKVSAHNFEIESAVDVIAESEYPIEQIRCAGQYLLVVYKNDVLQRVHQFSLQGEFIREIELPANGMAQLVNQSPKDKLGLVVCADLATPIHLNQFALDDGRVSTRFEPSLPFNRDQFETRQVFYPSKDGTQIPMFIVQPKGLELDGNTPVILYGYGGFNVTVPPVINAGIATWLEAGGVYAIANIRGGGEYGKAWHRSGTRHKRQNVFDDFIAGAEYLVENKYGSSETLVIRGGSNGGLLVGACMTQRPELFKAALPAVGVLDMLRYHQFTSGAGWAYDYGIADDDEAMFQTLKSYSPLHNLRAGVQYPATLITTGDHDDRVVPAHSFKFAAQLQYCAEQQAIGTAPALIRVNKNEGHGAGKSMQTIIEESTDAYAFIFKVLGKVPAFFND
jgi:prolyl oligopeptidase